VTVNGLSYLLSVYLTAKPTIISNSFDQYFKKLIPEFPLPTYSNMKDNFRLYVPTINTIATITVTSTAPNTNHAAFTT
jgi:hypothetical protein